MGTERKNKNKWRGWKIGIGVVKNVFRKGVGIGVNAKMIYSGVYDGRQEGIDKAGFC